MSLASRTGMQVRLEGFDGLRACAALSVLAYHVCLVCALSRSGPLAPYFSLLKAGVAVFFVISGFLLYLPCARAIRRGRPLPDWRTYGERRAVRILPAYWVVLTAAPLLATIAMTGGWWRYYGLMQVYNPHTAVNAGLPVAWSLCVEISFYAVLPLFARAMASIVARRPASKAAGTQLAIVACLAAASAGLRYALAGSAFRLIPHGGLVLATTLPGLFDWFAVGIAFAVLRSEWEAGTRRAPRLASLAERPGLCWLLAAACYSLAAPTQLGDQFLPLYGVVTHVAVGVAAGLLVLPAVAPVRTGARSWPMALLRHPLAVWLGVISYGIYLWHVPLVEAIRGPFSHIPSDPASAATALGLLVVILAGAVALAAGSWYLVERPSQRLLARRNAAAPVPVPAG